MAQVSQELRALLNQQSVSEVVRDSMAAKGCLAVAMFASWVETRSDLKAAFLAGTAVAEKP